MRYVEDCLRTVLDTHYPNFEVLFVDNALTDGGLDYVIRRYGGDPRLKIIKNAENYGFAKGNNIGVTHANGDYIVFLNVDVKVDPNWIRELIEVMKSDPTIGAAQAKLLRLDDKHRIDTCGHMLTPFGFTYERGGGEVDRGQYDHVAEIFGGEGAALIIRRKVFEEIGGFDEDFFLLREETDLCWMVWLHGYRVVFVPKALVYHAMGGSLKASQIEATLPLYYFKRNMMITLVKNLELKNIIKIIPVHLLLSIADAVANDVRNRSNVGICSTLKAIIWLTANFKSVWKKHLKVKALRKLNDNEFFPKIMLKISPLEKLRERSRIIA
jgi:GT2 family glycosyltransferase